MSAVPIIKRLHIVCTRCGTGTSYDVPVEQLRTATFVCPTHGELDVDRTEFRNFALVGSHRSRVRRRERWGSFRQTIRAQPAQRS